MAAKLMENPDILLCAELVREFLEFYKMDFTLQVFVPECNLPREDKVREKIDTKINVKRTDPPIPALMQILQAFKSGISQPAAPQDEKKNEMSTVKYGGFGIDPEFMYI